MSKRYHHLTPEDRAAIQLMRRSYSIRSIARYLSRAPSTVCRELKRLGSHPYDASLAARQARSNRHRPRRQPKLHSGSELWDFVCHMLRRRWSPEQIAFTLKCMNPDNPDLQVSHESIYTALYVRPRGTLKKELLACLRQGHKTRRRRSQGQDRRPQIPDLVSIHMRPPEVEDRIMPGHWEGDLIMGAGNRSAIGTLVERTTRLVILCRMEGTTATAAAVAFSDKLNEVPAVMRKTMTYDRGSEMVRHAEITQKTGTAVYFADPHAPWQRGSNENTNGLLRQYFPKGTDLSGYTQEELDAVADQMNGRPRKTLGWQTPLQVFTDVLRRSLSGPEDIH